ncbi:hypothetical protein Tco_0576158 [Tanacetum coccineum]
MYDMIKEGAMSWPTEWFEKFPNLRNINVPTLAENVQDKVVFTMGNVVLYQLHNSFNTIDEAYLWMLVLGIYYDDEAAVSP